MQFSGFPRDVLCTPVPDPILGVLLAEIEDLAELKVTLRGLWLLKQKGQFPRTLTQEEFLSDPVLLRGLQAANANNEEVAEAVYRGLRLAVERGTFLSCQPDPEHPEQQIYLLNTETDRNAMTRNGWQRSVPEERISPSEAVDLPTSARPNIFTLYEDNVGTIGPMLAEELRAA
ncbi:MAG: hypothetical protein ACE5Q6_03470, partial [Dehalococcoidia bacterium]